MIRPPIPASLLSTGLKPVWLAARTQLDRFGPERRGSVARPDLDPQSMLILESLMGRRLTKRIDLDKLEKALVKRGIGSSLCEALAHLGLPPSEEARARRESRARQSAARAALAKAIEFWNEPWASAWANEILKAGFLAGLDADDVAHLMTGVRRLIDHVDRLDPPQTSRTELAAALFGSAHALDRGKNDDGSHDPRPALSHRRPP